MLGVMPISEAIKLARIQGVDLVCIVPDAIPPICQLMDFGKYRYEQGKQKKETRKQFGDKSACQSGTQTGEVLSAGLWEVSVWKESRACHRAGRIKEVQISPNIDAHDFGVKLRHAIEFLCDDAKVKVTLLFRGRENSHKEIGFQQVERFIKELTPYARPNGPAKLIGNRIHVVLNPLPGDKRPPN